MNWIEIGACDYNTLLDRVGESNTGWEMIFEPVPELFNNLLLKPRMNNVQYFNCAVTNDHRELIEFTNVSPELIAAKSLPDWVKSCGTTKTSHPTLSHFCYDSFTHQSIVKNMHISNLMNIIPTGDSIHLLKIDTEGNDFEILDNWDFPRHKPWHIQFESKLMTDEQLSHIQTKMSNVGYVMFPGKEIDFLGNPYNHIAILEL